MDAVLSYCDALDAAAALLVQTIHRFQHFLGHWLILRAASVDISMIPSKADFEAGTSGIRNPERFFEQSEDFLNPKLESVSVNKVKIRKAIGNLKNGAAPGLDGVPPLALKYKSCPKILSTHQKSPKGGVQF